MGTFPKELDQVWRQRRKELGRELTASEGIDVEGALFESWVDAERFDELIRRIHSVYDVEGGVHEIAVLGYALRERKDVPRIHSLFRGLLSRRLKSFWKAWRTAEEGHIGGMLLAAQRCASAMEAYVEYYHSLWAVDLGEECDRLQQEMLALQQRREFQGLRADVRAGE